MVSRMTYTFHKQLDMAPDEAATLVTQRLAEQGFGILTEIHVQATLKKKLDEDIGPYLILGACSPAHAFQALQTEERIGAMLPCNVIVRVTADGKTEVAAVDPEASMKAIENPALGAVACEVRERLRSIIDAL